MASSALFRAYVDGAYFKITLYRSEGRLDHCYIFVTIMRVLYTHILAQKVRLNHITAITKAQIETLMKTDVIQYALLDKTLIEVEDNGVRYILKRNPVRTEEIANSRKSKQASLENFISSQNVYLREHSKAKLEVALKKVKAKIKRLGIDKWQQLKQRIVYYRLALMVKH